MNETGRCSVDDTAKRVLAFARTSRRLYPRGGIHGLEPAELQVLVALWRRPGATVGEIATLIEVNRSSVSNALRRLRHEALVSEGEDPDGRRRPQTLTGRGQDFTRDFLGLAAAVFAAAEDRNP